MVSPIENAADNADMVPPWLIPMLRADYFVPCLHGGSHRRECNFFCFDCLGDAFCSNCSVHHRDHNVIQVRRTSYQNAVRVSDIQRYIDISCVQPYVINSAKVMFLNERPQARPAKGVTCTCEVCCRSLPESFRFCSLGCKLNAIRTGDISLTFTLRSFQHKGDSRAANGYDLDDPSAPRKKIRKTHLFSGMMSGLAIGSGGRKLIIGVRRPSGSGDSGISPETPPIYNHRNSRKRKGVPRRAPF